MPLEGLVRDRINRDVRLLIQFDVDDVGFVYLYLRRDQGHIGPRHDRAGHRALDTRHDGFPDPDRKIGDDPVQRRDHGVFLQDIVKARQTGLGLGDPPLRGQLLSQRLGFHRLRLLHPCLGVFYHGKRGIILGLLLVVVLLGKQLTFIELFGAVDVQLGPLQFGLGLVQAGVGGGDGVFRGLGARFGGCGIGLRGPDGRLLRRDIGAGLRVFDLRHNLALPHMVAFLDPDVGERAHGVGPQVDIVLRLNLAGGGHNGSEVLPHDPPGLYGDDAALVHLDAGQNAAGDQQHQKQD